MRLLHTSDWHLGATLHLAARDEEHRRTLAWLVDTMAAHEVDVLVVAGDVYHHANPSAQAQRLLFEFLAAARRQLPALRVVLVGGNHDSAARLDAPREVLDPLGVVVVGGAIDGWEERALVPIADRTGAIRCVVVAVPYIHEYRLGVASIGHDDGAYRTALTEAFRARYDALAEEASRRWPGVPLVATGHLTCTGASPDDYDTPLHRVGGESGLPATIFSEVWSYVALGHIHRPYPVDGDRVRYAGSLFPLRSSEIAHPHQVRLVDVRPDGSITTRAVDVPLPRTITDVRGSFEEVLATLQALRPVGDLPAYVLAAIELDSPDTSAEQRLAEALADRKDLTLVRVTARPRVSVESATESRPVDVDVVTATPEEVFTLLYRATFPEGTPPDDLLAAFRAAVAAANAGGAP